MRRPMNLNLFGHKLMILALLAMIPSLAYSQISSSANGTAGVTIVEQNLSVESIQALSFGSIFPISIPATVRLALPNSSPNSTPSVITSDSNVLVTGAQTSGKWEITGVSNAQVTVTLPTDPITIEDTASNTMEVSNWTITSTTGNALNLFLNSSGTRQFAITATLALGANQAAGGYAGSYPISISYQ